MAGFLEKGSENMKVPYQKKWQVRIAETKKAIQGKPVEIKTKLNKGKTHLEIEFWEMPTKSIINKRNPRLITRIAQRLPGKWK